MECTEVFTYCIVNTNIKCYNQKWAIMLLIVLLTFSNVFGNQPPRFLLVESEILLHLKEGPETPVGSLISTLRGEDPEGEYLYFGVRGQVGNELIRIENVNRTAAHVYLQKELDRETQDDYNLILTLTDGHRGNLIEQSMRILVEDINDNKPIFKSYNSTIFVKEGSQPRIISTLEATDLDEGSYGQVVYHLLPIDGDLGNFKIETKNGKGVLSLVRELDFEDKLLYQLQVLAIDRPNIGRKNTGTAAIVVKVIDIEDRPPEFIKVPPVTKIPEDTPQGSKILKVLAIDGDREINNNIHYRITDDDSSNLFEIERETGWVYVKNSLDRETGDRNGAYILKIQAIEMGSKVTPIPKTETEVTVLLTDINDEAPTFRSDSYVGEINENAQLNVPITFLGNNMPEVYDYDQGKNGSFKLTLEGDNGIFDITPNEVINEASFLIRVKNNTLLDYEERQVLHFKVIAREIVEENPKSSTVEVIVHIRDANDNIPVFELMEYVAYISEDVEAGTSVLKVIAYDIDSEEYGSEGIRYTELRGQISHKLNLDPISGLITVRKGGEEFDREHVAAYFLTVVARDNLGVGNRNTVQLQVIIKDVNDNAPHFLQSRYEAKIYENELAFANPFFVEAFDRDMEGTSNNDIRFTIVDGDAMNNFLINEITGEISINVPLDFEAMNDTEEYRYCNLTVQAKDLGKPPQENNVSVIIYVQDKNDHSPVFSELQYSASVREDIRPGDPIIQLHALDNDGSLANSQIVYRIVSGPQDKFIIHPEKGIISVAPGGNLDPDVTIPKTLFHLLKVAAIDGGIGVEQKQAVVKVNISVLDVNNKSPEFRDPGIVSIKENSSYGTIVAQLKAFDKDDNPDLRFTLDPTKCESRSEEGILVRLLPKDYAALFEVTFTGIVKIRGLLDRELMETVKLRVSVEDRNAVGFRQIASGTLTIKIEDVNDNNPVFQKTLYRIAVPENSKPETSILNVVADDKDVNRTLIYELQGSYSITNYVTIDSNTGELTVNNKMDRELLPWINFTVKATDNGIPPLSGYSNISIQVLDENDNNPVFTEETLIFHVHENATVGTKIATIQAKDADEGEYGTVSYSLDTKTSLGKFAINTETGMLSVAESLDRESKDKYMLIIEAWDNFKAGFSTGESRNAFKQVTIIVSDINDHVPKLLLPKSCISVSEYHATGEIVSTIKATDDDDATTRNAHVDFVIKEGNEAGLFALEAVDHLTARLLVARSLKQEIGNHTVTILVMDRGDPSLHSSEDFTICITDINDHSPRFIKPLQNQTIKIPENTEIAVSVTQVETVDDDIGLNGEVRYVIIKDQRGDWKTFQIDEKTGNITLKLLLDREKQKKYEIRVEAKDLGFPPLSSYLDIYFYITNVIDVEPQFSTSEMVIKFKENLEPGQETVILPDTVDLEEYDSDNVKASICYFIAGGKHEDRELFHVDPVTHEVTITTSLDRELQPTHYFIVQATKDCLNKPHPNEEFLPNSNSTLRVKVQVEDTNDNAPYFVKDIFTGGMTTDTTFGAVIMKVQAVDLDFGINSKLNYYIVGGIQSTLSDEYHHLGTSPFLMNQTSGEILLNFYPQKSMKGYFHFTVLVNDTDGLEDTVMVMLYLVREDQKMRLTIRLTPDEFRPKSDKFQSVLSNVTDTIVNVDSFKYHENEDGSVDRTKTDILVHFVQREENAILDYKDAAQLVDKNIRGLVSLFQEFNVLEGKPAVPNDHTSPEEILMSWLIGSTVCLGLLNALILCICIVQRNRYKRQLKAATVIAYDAQNSSLNRSSVPNTNLHSLEGSNPIWMHSYENEWYKEDDSVSIGTQASNSNNSLDENVINDTDAQSRSSTAPPHDYTSSNANDVNTKISNFGTSTRANSKKQQKDGLSQDSVCIKEQNDLNKLGLQKHNIYESLCLNGNSILAHIETTEL